MSEEQNTNDAGSDTNSTSSVNETKKRTRRNPSFPTTSFEEALLLAKAIQEHGGNSRQVRRLTLFEKLGRSPDSGPTRTLISNSSRYGLTIGSYSAESLQLTEEGAIVSDLEQSEKKRKEIQFKLAIQKFEPFKTLYEQYKGNKTPALDVMRDFASDHGIKHEDVNECVDIFIVNAKFIGLLKPIAGAERLLPIEHILEELPIDTQLKNTKYVETPKPKSLNQDLNDLSKMCFYISPIGEAGSEQRKHSDLCLQQLVIPALEQFNLKVVRADQIEKPGLITSQIIEHLIKAKLVIADLSFHNPNVFYELAIRHACRKPAIHIIRKGDQIPFDVGQSRTIKIDTTDIYTFVPQMETYKSEIANQARQALDDPESAENPIMAFAPEFFSKLN